ncbi:transmembrane sensor [Methylopila capsulata]|uniref:Iron dicitrate transporter FecR n=1 Tax=Methylopila capsulata TaxID=61654 RepID=A0A9W6IS67_9HYPH|nr:FecR domain-containing protein [Methylopila capsulata]MBM7851197.1 transmembrane sensor [Methylopila capsulata]GLK54255.1 iron dicitrate transporter FecR [Methylopila capsulata]
MSDENDSDLEEATDWLLRLRDRPGDRRLAEAGLRWRSSSLERQAAWDEAEMAWSALGRSEPALRHVWQRPPPAAWRSGGRAVIAAAALAACLALVLGPTLALWLEADYVTGTGETRVIRLADGSTVHLGPGSALKANSGRSAALLEGEALFEIARDPDRPFAVSAGGVEVRVLGTVFDLRMTSGMVDVELAKGAVEARYGSADGPGPAPLAPGEALSFSRATGEASRRPIAPEDVGSWRQGRLFVEDATLESVVEQIRRRHGAWIVLADRELAAKRVTGLYDLTDPDRALHALVAPFGGAVLSISPYLRLVSGL